MSSLASILLFIIILSMIIILLASALSKKSIPDREKNSPFECGFDPFSLSRIPFSLRFFMIGIIFLIFDVEIAILLPIPLLLENLNLISWNIISLIITIILLTGLLHEWNFGALDWTK